MKNSLLQKVLALGALTVAPFQAHSVIVPLITPHDFQPQYSEEEKDAMAKGDLITLSPSYR
jgi:hypothetical protein